MYLTSVLWGILATLTVFISIYYICPKIEQNNSSIDTSLPSRQIAYSKRAKIMSLKIVILLVCSLGLSYLCGWKALQYTDSYINSIKLLVVYLFLLSSAIIDYKFKIIPNKLVLWLFMSRFLFLGVEILLFSFESVYTIANSCIGAVFCFFVLLLTEFITRGGIGMGDVKLCSGVAFLCGIYAAVSMLVVASFACAFMSLILIISKKKTTKDDIPFGPFILFGYIVTVISGAF